MPLQFKANHHQAIDISIASFASYLERYVDLQYPGNEVHWSVSSNPSELRSAIPNESEFANASCSVHSRKHSNEDVISVGITCAEGHLQPIAWATNAGNREQSWAIAETATALIESLYHRHELPLVVDFSKSLFNVTHRTG